MSLISELKAENVSLKRKQKNLIIQLHELKKDGRLISDFIPDKIISNNKEQSKYNKVKCLISQKENITMGKSYILIDEYSLKGKHVVQIIDNQNVIRSYIKKKFF